MPTGHLLRSLLVSCSLEFSCYLLRSTGKFTWKYGEVHHSVRGRSHSRTGKCASAVQGSATGFVDLLTGRWICVRGSSRSSRIFVTNRSRTGKYTNLLSPELNNPYVEVRLCRDWHACLCTRKFTLLFMIAVQGSSPFLAVSTLRSAPLRTWKFKSEERAASLRTWKFTPSGPWLPYREVRKPQATSAQRSYVEVHSQVADACRRVK